MPKDNQKNKKDSSNLKTIKDVPKNYKTKAQIQGDLDNSLLDIEDYKRKILDLEATIEQKDVKISHLEKILENSVPVLGSGDEFQLDEVTIARMQLNKLGKLAAVRELNNEEARRFEIFSRVVQNDAKIGDRTPKRPILKDVSPSKLIEIASGKPKNTLNE